MDALGLDYEYTIDVEEVRKLGFQTTPLLKVDDKVMMFPDAVNWLKSVGVKN